MKRIALTAAILVLGTGIAAAAPGKYNRGSGYAAKAQVSKSYGRSHGVKAYRNNRRVGHISRFERRMIARSRARLQRIKWRARADGRVTRFERRRIRIATARHHRLVRRARRS